MKRSSIRPGRKPIGRSQKSHKVAEKECFALIQELVALRDNETCVLCGKPGNGGGHHVIKRRYRAVAFDPRNVYTLCLECHGRDDTSPKNLQHDLQVYMGFVNWYEMCTMAERKVYIDHAEVADKLRTLIKEYGG